MSPNASAQVGKFRKQNVTLYQRQCAKCLRNRLSAELEITVMFNTKCQLSTLVHNEKVKMLSLLNLIEVKLQEIPTVKLNNGAAQCMSIFELLCVRCIH